VVSKKQFDYNKMTIKQTEKQLFSYNSQTTDNWFATSKQSIGEPPKGGSLNQLLCFWETIVEKELLC